MPDAVDRRSLVQSVSRAWRVLDALKASGRKSPRDISLETGIERTVVYRLLRTLEQESAVIEDQGSWRLADGLLDLSTAYLEDLHFARTAPAFAMDLHRRVVAGHPWLVSLGVPVADHVVLVERFWTADSPLNSTTAIGARFALDVSATGLSMLARMSPDEGRRRLGEERYAEASSQVHTVRDSDFLAFSSDGLRPGVSAIAAAVTDRTGTVVGAVNVSGLKLEEHLAPTSDVAQHVRRTAASIMAALR